MSEKKFRVLAASRMKDGHRRLGVLLPDTTPVEIEATAAQIAEAKADPDVILLELEGPDTDELAAKMFPALAGGHALKRAEERATKAEAKVAEFEAKLAELSKAKK
jgi:hypothetical protein